MDWKDDGFSYPIQSFHDLLQPSTVFGVGCTMDRHQGVPARSEIEMVQNSRLLARKRPILEQCIQHHIPHPMHRSFDSFGGKSLHCRLARAQVQVSQTVVLLLDEKALGAVSL